MNFGTNLGSISAKMTLDISNFVQQLDLAQSQAQKLAQTQSKGWDLGNKLTSMGKTLTTGLTLPLAGIAAASIKVGNEFQYQMSRVQAISGATGSELEKMKGQAVQLGASTAFSAKEAAGGMENLASAGFTVNEIMNAMPGVLDLAAVSGGDVAASSEAMATSLRAFGLEASDAGHVANIFAKAAADTNAETGDMAEAMKYVAPVAHAMGLSIEETAASIGIMSDAGIKGSQAGTTLRGALTRLAKPTKAMQKSMDELGVSFYDAEGNMIPLKDQIGLLKKATAGLTQEEKNRHLTTLYGQQSLSGMLALLDAGPEKLEKMTMGLKNSSGAAEEMAKTMQNNLKSQIEQMFGAMESAAIIIQQILEPALSKLVVGITNLIEKFVNMSPLGQKMVVIFAGMVAALGPLLVIVGTAITTFIKLKVAFTLLGPAAVGLMGKISLAIGGFYALVAIFMILYTKSETFRNAVNWLASALKDVLAGAVKFIVGLFTNFGPTMEKAWEGLKKFGSSIGELFGNMFSGLGSTLASLGSAISSGLGSALEWVTNSFQRLGTIISTYLSGPIDWLKNAFSSLSEAMSGQLGTAVSFIGNYLEKMGGQFGKLGGVVSIAVSVLTKVGLAMAGITGPMGMVISLVIGLVSAWIRTGDISADGLTQVFNDIVSGIENTANMISTYLPQFIQKGTEIIVNLINGITAKIPDIVTAITSIIESLTNALVTALPQIMTAGITILTSLIEGILSALPQLVTAGVQIITGLLNAFVTALPQISQAGIQILTTLIDSFVTMLPMIIQAGIQIITALLGAIVVALPQLVEAGTQIITTLVNAIITFLPQLIQAGIQIITALLGALVTALPQLIEAGVQILMALIQGIISILPALIEAAIQIITALIQALITALPQIIEAGIQLIMALIEGLIQVIPQIIEAAIQIILALVNGLIQALPQLIDAGVQLITALLQGLIQVIPQIVAGALQIMAALLQAIIGAVPQLLSAGVQLIQSLVQGILSLIGSVIGAGANLMSQLVSKIGSFAGQMLSKGGQLIQQFISGVAGKIGSAVGKIGEMGSQMVSRVGNFVGQMASAGRNFVMGFVNGISGAIGAAASKAAEMARSALNAAKSFLGIKSPSRRMIEVGRWTGEGMAIGIEKMTSTVHDKAEAMAEAVTDAMSGVKMSIDENGIVETAKNAYNELARVIPNQFGSDGYLNLQSAADSESIDLYKKGDRNGEEGAPGADEGSGGGGNVTIGTIIVRSDDDVDKLSRGLYNKSKETLSGLGNIVTP